MLMPYHVLAGDTQECNSTVQCQSVVDNARGESIKLSVLPRGTSSFPSHFTSENAVHDTVGGQQRYQADIDAASTVFQYLSGRCVHHKPYFQQRVHWSCGG